MSELRPIELDVLEDLLEGLGDDGAPATIDVEDPEARRIVGERLAEYRAILQACREALPMEEVPAGVLDEVLETARRSDTSAASGRPSLWQRLRGTFVIPGLALAAAAALIIVIVRPQDEPASESPVIARAQRAEVSAPESVEGEAVDERLADAHLDPVKGEAALEARGGGVLDPGALPRDEEAPAGIPGLRKSEAEEEDGELIGGADLQRQASRPTSATSKAPAKASKTSSPAQRPSEQPKPAPSPSTGPSSKSGGLGAAADVQSHWSQIETGDARRRNGKCSTARSSYEKALEAAKASGDARAVARAHAGLGLCEAHAGRQRAADDHFAKARAADSTVSGFIEAELKR
jgi:hypothetical protein